MDLVNLINPICLRKMDLEAANLLLMLIGAEPIGGFSEQLELGELTIALSQLSSCNDIFLT